MNKKNMVILDANAYVHSSFNGYEAQLDINGKDQRVLYGLINALLSLSYQIPSIDVIVVVFDPEDGSLYRKSLFPAYKANRPPPDKELTKQKLYAKLIIQNHLGIPVVNYPGYEADDIIGSLSKKYKDEYKVIIVSPDKDLAQLINEDVVLFKRVRTKTTKGYKTISHINIFEEYGVKAEQIPDWLALMGDVADNLPGLDKVGEKTAAKILAQYPTLEHLLSIIHEHKDIKFKEKVMQNKDSLLLVKKLATIECDLPLDNSINDSIQLSNNIRNDADYHKKLIKIKNHFNWPLNFIDMFL